MLSVKKFKTLFGWRGKAEQGQEGLGEGDQRHPDFIHKPTIFRIQAFLNGFCEFFFK